jgi:hypothetical protein
MKTLGDSMGKIFESSDIQDSFGFVYLISCSKNSRRDIWGRKYFWTFRTPKGTNLEELRSESDWKRCHGILSQNSKKT